MAIYQSADIVLCSLVVYELRHGAEPVRTRRANTRSLMYFCNLLFLYRSTMPARVNVRRFALGWNEVVRRSVRTICK